MQLPPELFAEILAFTRPDPHGEMRKAPRVQLTATIVAHKLGDAHGIQVHVRDMSQEGMGLMSTRPFDPGQRFVVVLPRGAAEPDVTIICEVRHCTRVAEEIYHIGVLFLDDGRSLK